MQSATWDFQVQQQKQQQQYLFRHTDNISR